MPPTPLTYLAGRFLRPVNVVQIILNPGGTGVLTSSELSNWIWAVAASSEHIARVANLMGPVGDLSSAPHRRDTPFRNVHFGMIGTIGQQLTTGK